MCEADIYLLSGSDNYQIALGGSCTNTIYQIVLFELTSNSKKVEVVNGSALTLALPRWGWPCPRSRSRPPRPAPAVPSGRSGPCQRPHPARSRRHETRREAGGGRGSRGQAARPGAREARRTPAAGASAWAVALALGAFGGYTLYI